MTPKTHRLDVRGLRVVTRTPRRFIVVAVRPEAIHTPEGWLVAFAHVIKRTDALSTARAAARRHDRGHGVTVVTIDTETGEEIS
jgi:hypothetical protein